MASGAVVIPDNHSQRQQDVWTVITSLVLDGIASPHTRRAYSQALEEFLIWFRDVPGREFNKAAVQKYRSELQAKGLAPSSINVRLSAIAAWRWKRPTTIGWLRISPPESDAPKAPGGEECGWDNGSLRRKRNPC